MHYASFKGNYDMMILLLEHGADPYSRNMCCVNYLQCGAQGNKAMTIAFFLHLGIDVNEPDLNNGSTALHWASHTNSDQAQRMILSWPGVDLDARDKMDQTSLHQAV